MTFKWTLSRPGIAVEFETGSISEALGMLEAEGTQIQAAFGFSPGGGIQSGGVATVPGEILQEDAAPKGKPGRKPKDLTAAIAPAPMPIPSQATVLPAIAQAAPALPAPATAILPPNTLVPAAAPPPPNLAIPLDGGIPPFLARSPDLAPAAPPPPLPKAPAPPPVGVLGAKVVAALDIRKAGNPNDSEGKLLADWLANTGLTIPGATYDQACRVVLMTSDEKLAPLCGPLGI